MEMDASTSNTASLVEKEIPFALDNKTLIILAQFKEDILNAITTFKEDITVVNTRIDGVHQDIEEHTSLIDQLKSKVDALKQKCEMLEKQAPSPASDQLLSKVEELERKYDSLEKQASAPSSATIHVTHIAQNVPGTFREPSVKTKETSQLELSDV